VKLKEWVACQGCGKTATDRHHIFNAANKKRSEKYNYMLDLCHVCHMNLHQDYEFWNKCKALCQTEYELNRGSRNDFIKEFGRSYL